MTILNMNLPEKDVEEFYNLYHKLLFYVNEKYNIIKSLESPQDLFKTSMDELIELKDKLYGHPELIDSFIRENPTGFSSQELESIRGLKNFVKGKFLIVSYQKNYTVFLDPSDPPKAYGVLGLRSSLQEMLGPDLPIRVGAILLPFRDKIIYDGILLPDRVIFGPNVRRDFKVIYDLSKELHGIITRLPFHHLKTDLDDFNKLKSYLKSKHSRDAYYNEIQELVNKDHRLKTYYSQAMGKVEARTLTRKLKTAGVTKGWFAVIEGMIIASGRTREEVESILGELLPSEKRELACVFKLR